ncbi:hypothetical protein AB1Y20_008587 [Prymnesium parvum]|uniref:Uncharacterized protein n=1 Tax=Prymnesium parvum TaxID=97485 RepID=A0AB34ITK8_PRYPA
MIEGIVADWETAWKKVLTHFVNARLEQYQLAGWKDPQLYFGKELADKVVKWRQNPPQNGFDGAFDAFVNARVYGCGQLISVCSGRELALLVPPLAQVDPKIPEPFWELVKTCEAVKRSLKHPPPPPDDAEAYKKAIEDEEDRSAAARVLSDLTGLKLSQLLEDDERYCMELCILLRHVRAHQGWSPTSDDQIKLALFTEQTFTLVARQLSKRLREFMVVGDEHEALTAGLSMFSMGA